MHLTTHLKRKLTLVVVKVTFWENWSQKKINFPFNNWNIIPSCFVRGFSWPFRHHFHHSHHHHVEVQVMMAITTLTTSGRPGTCSPGNVWSPSRRRDTFPPSCTPVDASSPALSWGELASLFQYFHFNVLAAIIVAHAFMTSLIWCGIVIFL